MSTFEKIVGLLDKLSWQEQIDLIGVISERLRQTGSASPEASDEEEPEDENEGREWRPRLRQMIEWGLVKPQEDTLFLLGHPDQSALLLDANHVAFQGKRVEINQWARGLKGWKSINIYTSVVVQNDGRTLDEIRRAYMEKNRME